MEIDINFESKALLRELATEHGIKASLSTEGNYEAIFTRDAVIAGISGLLIGDEKVTDSFVVTLTKLREFQKAEGQIASNYKVNDSGNIEISYGTLSYKVDACTWYMIGVGMCAKAGLIVKSEWEASLDKLVSLLESLEYNGRGLIYVPQGGNWADEYLCEGYVLYDQVLRFWGMKLVGEAFSNEKWKAKSELIIKVVSDNYRPNSTTTKPYHEIAYHRASQNEHDYYDAWFKPSGYSGTFDLAANSLLMLVADDLDHDENKVLRWIGDNFLGKHILPPAFYPVIGESDQEWGALSTYYLFTFKNKPCHYHNGGVWWVWLGWLGAALKKRGLHGLFDLLYDTTHNIVNKSEDFDFQEYLDSCTYTPAGTRKMAFTASGLLMLDYFKNNENFEHF